MFKVIKDFFDMLKWKYICWKVFDNKKRDKRK